MLRRAGVEAIVLKGQFAARWLRPDGGTRYSYDVDLLIAPAGDLEVEVVEDGVRAKAAGEVGDRDHGRSFV